MVQLNSVDESYCFCPGLCPGGYPRDSFVRRRASRRSRPVLTCIAHVWFHSITRCSVAPPLGARTGLNLKPDVTRRMKSANMRLAFRALRRSASDALACSRRSIGPRPSHSKRPEAMIRIARHPKYFPSSLFRLGCLTCMNPAFLNCPMARSHRRWPRPESLTMVFMSMSMKPLARVGTPRHRDARSRCDSMVSRTTRHASRRSLRIFRSPWVKSGGHFLGWSNQTLVRSAARERMRGRPPFPLRIGRMASSRGCLGSWPQRLPVNPGPGEGEP